MAFPDITLTTAYIAQQAYSSNDVKVIQINDNAEAQTLNVFCQLGTNPSFKYWIPVLSGSNYNVNWTNDNVTTAITNYFVNPSA